MSPGPTANALTGQNRYQTFAPCFSSCKAEFPNKPEMPADTGGDLEEQPEILYADIYAGVFSKAVSKFKAKSVIIEIPPLYPFYVFPVFL